MKNSIRVIGFYLLMFIISLTFASVVIADGSISGAISYEEAQTGTIYVAAFTTPLSCSPPNPQDPSYYIQLPTLGSYTLSDLPDGTYYVGSIIMTCGEDCNIQPTDPWGIYDGCDNIMPVVISGGNVVSGIDINLVDGTEDFPNPFASQYTQFEFRLLEFPFRTPTDIARMAAFGIPNWSGTEPHNGIDLIIYDSLTSSKIISPTNGTISSITVSENPYSNPPNQMLLSIEIYINSEWSVDLVIEPSTVDEQIKVAQMQAVGVDVGQVVVVGEEIADLLVGDLGYPHLHYMVMRNSEILCAYNYSSQTAKAIFEEIATTRENNNLPDGNICYGLQCTDDDIDTYAIEGGSCGALDCNDDDSAINPGATEVCDTIDNNCDGQIDEKCPNISVSPTRYNFKKVSVGSPSLPKTFTVSNTGSTDLKIKRLRLIGINPTEFSLQNDTCSRTTLTPSTTCTFDVVFAPTSIGIKRAKIKIPSNDPDTSVFRAGLKGEGI